MASRTSTPQSRSRSSTGSSSSSDTTMIDAPPQSPSRPVRLRNLSTSNPSTAPTTASDPTFSLLLSLPRELRDRIYTFALTSPSPFWWPNQAAVKYEHNIAPNLLRASRQVYEEAALVIYSENKFAFTHPSDCNIFRVVASPASRNITSVYFRIRERDLRLWTSYLGSKSQDRSLRADLPRLRSLWIFSRCGSMGTSAMLGQMVTVSQAIQGLQGLQGVVGGLGNLSPAIQVQLQAVQNVIGQHVHALTQHLQSFPQAVGNGGGAPPQTPQLLGMDANGTGNGNQIPPPPPPPQLPAMPFNQFAQGGFNPVQGHGQQQQHHQAPITVPHQHGTQNNPPDPSPLAQHLAYTQNANTVPPPPPLHHHALAPIPGQPPPQVLSQSTSGPHASPHHLHHHPHPLYTTFLRFEREIGLESLCLSLRETLRGRSEASSDTTSPVSPSPSPSYIPSPEVKIVCIMRVPRREVERLVSMYPDELSIEEKTGDARTKFRKIHGVEVSLELNGYPSSANSGGGSGSGHGNGNGTGSGSVVVDDGPAVTVQEP